MTDSTPSTITIEVPLSTLSGDPAAAPRTCGSCTLCCKVMGIKDPALEKPKDVWCPHAKKGCGCGIYETRPSICRDFKCLWLGNEFGRVYPEHRPDKIHGLLTMTTDGKNFVVHEDPGYERFARTALKDFIEKWLVDDAEHYVVVVCGRKRSFLGKRPVYDRLMAEGAAEVKV